MWHARRCSNDRFILKRDRDKHYLSAASSSAAAAADSLYTPKTASVHRVCPGGNSFLLLSLSEQTVVVSGGSYDDIFVCFNNGKIPLLWRHAWTAGLNAQSEDTRRITTGTRQGAARRKSGETKLVGGSLRPNWRSSQEKGINYTLYTRAVSGRDGCQQFTSHGCCSTCQFTAAHLGELSDVPTNLAQWLKVKQAKLPFANSSWFDVLYNVIKTQSLLSQAATKPVRQVFCNYMKNGFGPCGALATSKRDGRSVFACLYIYIYI